MLMPTWRKLIKINLIIFNLFYLHFCFGPQVCIGNSSFRICGVVTWHGNVRNILLHTYIHIISYFHQTFLFLLLAYHTRHLGCITVTNRDRQCLLSTVPVYQLAPSFPVYLLHGWIENLYMIFPYSIKARVTKTEIFQWVF